MTTSGSIETNNFTDSIESRKLAAQAEAKLDSIIASNDADALQAFIDERVSNPVFLKALETREKLLRKRDRMEKDYNNLYSRISYAQKKGQEADDLLPMQLQLNKLALRQRGIREAVMIQGSKLSNYRRAAARAAFHMSELRMEAAQANGTFLEYTRPTIGDLKIVGTFPPNTPEWHAARLSGIGGSDVGSIIKHNGDYSSSNYSQVFNVKAGLAEPEPITSRVALDSIERGNNWENAILQWFAAANPQLNVAFCKDSWEGVLKPHRKANFDGLIVDAEGNAEGVVEIKTSSNLGDWGPVEEGIWAVPRGYRLQVLWYALNAGLKYGFVVVLLNDVEYRSYRFDMSDPKIQELVEEIKLRTDEFWAEVEAAKVTPPVVRKKHRGFGAKPDYVRTGEFLAAYTGWSINSCHRAIRRAVADEQELLGVEKLDEVANQEVLFNLFAEHDPSKRRRPLIGVDLETTGQSPRSGRIIEIGIARMNAAGDSKVLMDQLFSVPDELARAGGLGMESVHGISPAMLEGKPRFEDPKLQEEMLAYLKLGVVVAHNAGFEDRWLAANLAGYSEARAAGEIVLLDTRHVSTYLMLKSEDSSLRTFSEDNGVPYEGAHRAIVDVLMMLKALRAFQSAIFRNGRFIRRNVTDKSRQLAVEELHSKAAH